MKLFQFAVLCGWLFSCSSPENQQQIALEDPPPTELSFSSQQIAHDADLWWARTLADVDGDGLLDVVLINNNGGGGWLGYLKGQTEDGPWEKVIVAESSPNDRPFAAGDLEAGDLDGDGDIDLIGVEHPGEWTDAAAEATLFWYEQDQETWTPHNIGSIPSALKDISVRDLDGDGLPEIVTVTYNAETLSVFRKGPGVDFEKAWDLIIDNLHEGMDIGDVDGDGLPDIAANGYWLSNPGSADGPWELQVVDSIWFNQEEEHWSRNATKVVCMDTDGDGKDEVFITHSEKTDYPLVRYQQEGDSWSRQVMMDSLTAAHSLQVVDVDLDGQHEVVTGYNRNRAIDIVKELGGDTAPTEFPVFVLKQSAVGSPQQIINTDGVYNLLAGDFEGDGDIDLIRLTSHNEKDMWLMVNELR